MRAIVVTRHGGPDSLELQTLPTPVPGPDEVLVRNTAIGVNFVDVQHRRGTPYPVQLPLIPGTEAAGDVVAVGPRGDESLVGSRVAHFGHLAGVYAEFTAVPARFAVPLPVEVSDEAAASIAMNGTTAHVLTRIALQVHDGNVVVVHSAGGSTGGAIVQLAAFLGARVLAVASTIARAESARPLGADEVLGLDPSLPQRVRELTGGRGADLVYDANGGPTFDLSLASLADGGTLVLYGQSGGPVAPFDPARLSGLTDAAGPGSLGVRWVASSQYLAGADERAAALRAVFEDVRQGRLAVGIAHRLPLEAAPEAHRLLEERRAQGKVLLLP
ncbi:quinone oxidoreductase family protein [Agromyces bauzanensis]